MQINDQSLAAQVYEIIRRQIARGELRPGERIYESDYTRQLRMSRTPIREALLKLEMDGLVVCNRRRSYNVRRLTVHDVKGIYETLGILEGASVGLAAPQINAEDIRLLREINREMEAPAQSGDMEVFGHINSKFHDVFLGKLDNPILCKTCDSVRALIYVFPARTSSLADWLIKSVEEHREIIRLVEAGNSEALASYIRDVHWSSEKNLPYIVDAFEQDGDTVPPI
jgi:DNA-binding GntR family transcriptional regulator